MPAGGGGAPPSAEGDMDWYQKWKDVVGMCQRQEGEIRNLQASRDPPCGQTPCLVDSASPSPTSSISSLSRACFEHMVTGRPWFPQKLLNRQQGEMDGDLDSLGGGGGSLKSSGAGGGGRGGGSASSISEVGLAFTPPSVKDLGDATLHMPHLAFAWCARTFKSPVRR